MKAVVVYSSARHKGFSSLAADYAADLLEHEGAEVCRYRLHEMDIRPCRGCFACRRREGCVIKDDMTELFEQVVTSDFVVFATPIYCFETSSVYQEMFERLYPMLGGGMALGEGAKKYVHRYPSKSCMLIVAQGASRLMCSGARRRATKNFGMNGFKSLGTVVVDGTYAKKEFVLTDRQRNQIEKICKRASGKCSGR